MPVTTPHFYHSNDAREARAQLSRRVNQMMAERQKEITAESTARLERERIQLAREQQVKELSNALRTAIEPVIQPTVGTPRDLSKLNSVELLELGLREEREVAAQREAAKNAARAKALPEGWEQLSAYEKIQLAIEHGY